MNYRVHLYVTVRVEHELEAGSAEEAARQAFDTDLALHDRLDRPGQAYAEDIDEVCLVDPLTETRDRDGRFLPDCDHSQWLRVTQHKRPSKGWETVVVPASPFPSGPIPEEPIA